MFDDRIRSFVFITLPGLQQQPKKEKKPSSMMMMMIASSSAEQSKRHERDERRSLVTSLSRNTRGDPFPTLSTFIWTLHLRHPSHPLPISLTPEEDDNGIWWKMLSVSPSLVLCALFLHIQTLKLRGKDLPPEGLLHVDP
ncbi:hypothetical protein TNCV_4807361 [Trichonephila clavipes]|nr:hypothetical protein TNCV_4807361 [Trichonephila clavipes]